ncbi:MAG: hypothetical protein LBS27_08520 [Bifidobacteriaceae bacterium]|nr:hypothetical protein [Bifidobacteriaceae bacterium]
MSRRVVFEFSGFSEPVVAELLEDDAGFADKVWDELDQPAKMWIWHTQSSGDFFSSKGRPPIEAKFGGSQQAPLGGTAPPLMCDVPVGGIVYSGNTTFSYAYGHNVTEPIAVKGPIVARALDPAVLSRAGQHCLRSHTQTHQLVTVTARRGE